MVNVEQYMEIEMEDGAIKKSSCFCSDTKTILEPSKLIKCMRLTYSAANIVKH